MYESLLRNPPLPAVAESELNSNETFSSPVIFSQNGVRSALNSKVQSGGPRSIFQSCNRLGSIDCWKES